MTCYVRLLMRSTRGEQDPRSGVCRCSAECYWRSALPTASVILRASPRRPSIGRLPGVPTWIYSTPSRDFPFLRGNLPSSILKETAMSLPVRMRVRTLSSELAMRKLCGEWWSYRICISARDTWTVWSPLRMDLCTTCWISARVTWSHVRSTPRPAPRPLQTAAITWSDGRRRMWLIITIWTELSLSFFSTMTCNTPALILRMSSIAWNRRSRTKKHGSLQNSCWGRGCAFLI